MLNIHILDPFLAHEYAIEVDYRRGLSHALMELVVYER